MGQKKVRTRRHIEGNQRKGLLIRTKRSAIIHQVTIGSLATIYHHDSDILEFELHGELLSILGRGSLVGGPAMLTNAHVACAFSLPSDY